MPEDSRPSKAVLITGSSSGIGRATAGRLAEKGWTVYATARRPEGLADLEAQGCRPLQLDVTNEKSMTAAVAHIQDAEGAIGVLINNAGYSQSGAVETVSMSRVQRQFETNLFGPWRLIQLVLPGMRRQHWGKIVNISSMGGRLTFPGAAAYHATKHGLEALSDALRFEVGGFGVDVIVIEPGLIRTGYAAAANSAMEDLDEGPYGSFNDSVGSTTVQAYTGPLRVLGGEPESVARVIEKAIAARRPRTRYRVTPAAPMLITSRRLSPDRVWDWTLGRVFPRPGR